MFEHSPSKNIIFASSMFIVIFFAGCGNNTADNNNSDSARGVSDTNKITYLSQPLVANIYTADPSAHVFNNKIYIYPSHDINAGIPEKDDGSHFAMRDYHILSLDSVGGKVTDNGVAIDIKNIPWVGRQLWAPDAAFKNGIYYLYFPAKDKQDVFRIGVATSSSPTGPFTAEAKPIDGSFSIDPAIFSDSDGHSYMYLAVSGAGSCKDGKRVNMTRLPYRNLPILIHLP